jgi:hypothetical protein
MIKKISMLCNKARIEYAFTLFSATELVAPLVSPSETYFYILNDDKQRLEQILRKNNIFPAQKGNVICFLTDQNRLYGKFEIRGIKIISLPQLFADLFWYDGRGEEAAKEILKIIKGDKGV